MADQETYVSGEQHQASSGRPQRQVSIPLDKVGLVIGVILLCGISFWGGMSYQKTHTPATVATTTGPEQGGFGPGGGNVGQRRGTIGEVTAVSDSSITVKSQQGDSDSTYTVTTSTTVSDSGKSAAISDIKVGDTVVVMTASSDSKEAQRILLNPQMGRFGGPGGDAGTSGSAQTN